MSESQGGAGRREVAWRLFAAEFDDADLSYSESDEDRAPNYVVTPTGARVNRVFVVGVLTEVETVSEDYLRARVVDPSGPFVVYAGQYQPEALAFLEAAEPPAFVAVTGKARTYQPDDSDQVFTSVRPERISEVDAETRDRWVVQTAEQTLDRVARMAEGKASGLAGDDLRAALEEHGVEEGLAAGVPVALDYYGTTGTYLNAVRDLATGAARVVAGEADEAGTLTTDPGAGDDDVAALVEDPIDGSLVERARSGGDETADEPAEPATESPAEATADAGSAVGTAQASSGSSETAEPAGTKSAGVETTETASEAAGSADESPAATVDAEGETDVDEGGPDAVEDEPDATPESAAEPASGDGEAATETADDPTAEAEAVDDVEDFEPEFDLDEEEREEIEAEFGTEFQSGAEVDEPGAADIDAPEPDAGASAADTDAEDAGASGAESDEPSTGAESDTREVTESEPASAEPSEPDGDESEDVEGSGDDGDAEETAAETADAEPTADVDLEDAVMDAMEDLDEGDGADREAVLAAVVDRTGADPGDVEDAVQDALMSGRCYEPDDETLKPI